MALSKIGTIQRILAWQFMGLIIQSTSGMHNEHYSLQYHHYYRTHYIYCNVVQFSLERRT
jgi:hypothetical protein